MGKVLRLFLVVASKKTVSCRLESWLAMCARLKSAADSKTSMTNAHNSNSALFLLTQRRILISLQHCYRLTSYQRTTSHYFEPCERYTNLTAVYGRCWATHVEIIHPRHNGQRYNLADRVWLRRDIARIEIDSIEAPVRRYGTRTTHSHRYTDDFCAVRQYNQARFSL